MCAAACIFFAHCGVHFFAYMLAFFGIYAMIIKKGRTAHVLPKSLGTNKIHNSLKNMVKVQFS